MTLIRLLHVGCLGGALGLSCAHQVGPPPDASALRLHLTAQPRQATLLSADLRVTYFGPEGRLRASGLVVLARPDRLRAELEGPHGGLMMAVASDGQGLWALDVADNAFRHGSAAPAGWDALLGQDIGFGTADWLKLLWGETVPVDAAELKIAGSLWQATWPGADNTTLTALYHPATWQLQQVALRRAGAAQPLLEITYTGRDERGVPKEGCVRLPDAHSSILWTLREVEYDRAMPAQTFKLAPPPGARSQALP